MKFLFNFQPQFHERIARGEKLQTIRRHREDGKRPKPGDVACLYAHLRTAKARLLREAPVTRCRSIRIDFEDDSVVIDGHRLPWIEKVEFAMSDGFPTWTAMRQFFVELYGAGTFEGFCVEWAAP